MIPEDRAARIVHRLMAPGMGWDRFERMLTANTNPRWNRAVAYVADEIRTATRSAVAQELITGKLMRGEIDADTAKELDAMQWQKDFYRSRELLDEEPEWGGLLGLEARATSLEMRVTALEESREVEDG